MSRRTVLVAGASGLIGTAATEAFADAGWDVIAVARRRPEIAESPRIRHMSVDLMDPAVSAAAFAQMPDVSHIVYAASYERASLVSGWSDPEQMATNLAMLTNVVEPFAARGTLEHVTLMQGTKAYGVHLHAIPVPARERYARDDHQNFYWLQEDYIKSVAERTDVEWTILRPVHVVGPAYGVAYSTPPIIGAFAALCHEAGEPFGFPGGPFQVVKQVVDVRLLARATVWAATEPRARGEHFNVTNGEVFTWRDIWPVLADALSLPCAEIEPVSMAQLLPSRAEEWQAITERHALRALTIDDLIGSSHMYADYTFGYGFPGVPPPALVSTIKIKQAGFTETMDTEQTFRDAFRVLVERRVLPDYR